MSRGNVKGSVLASRLAYVRSERGEGALTLVLARLLPEDCALLSGILLPFAWYSFETNARLDRAICDEFDIGNEIFLRLGARSAEDNLTSASQKQWIVGKNPQALIKQTSTIYGVYYDTGRRDYERIDENTAVLRTYDSLSFSAEDCLTVVGWYERAIKMCGGKNVRVEERLCRARGDAWCEYACAWI